MTTSEDKTVRLWEMDLPVAIKQISDTGMQSIPSVCLLPSLLFTTLPPQATMHPSGQFFGAQAMDNTVLIYSASDKFQLKKSKMFKGHRTAGYACEVGFSPDGKYVSSGNADGELFVWNWGSTNIVKHYKCHDKVCRHMFTTSITPTPPTGTDVTCMAPNRVLQAPDLLLGQHHQVVGLGIPHKHPPYPRGQFSSAFIPESNHIHFFDVVPPSPQLAMCRSVLNYVPSRVLQNMLYLFFPFPLSPFSHPTVSHTTQHERP